ncbi:MAG: hypothetical protein C0510_06880 [Erythrobacter sp.]|nr:hypothetical protein [Erythrobacter sp.]
MAKKPTSRPAPDRYDPNSADMQAMRRMMARGTKAATAPPTKKPAARPAAKKPVLAREQYMERWQRADPEQIATIYGNQRRALERKFANDPKRQQQVLARFDADPRIQGMREIAGLVPVTTKRADLRRVAKRNRDAMIVQSGRRAASDGGINGGLGAAIPAGIRRGLFGIPERLAAAGLYYTGNSGNLDYDETLRGVRAKTDAELEQSGAGNFIGQLLGGFAGGGAAQSALVSGGGKLAASAAPLAQRAGTAVQSLFRLEKGRNVANAGKLAATGAGFGGAQAAGEGSDIATGAAIGAGGSVALGAAFKGAKFLGGKAGDILRLTGADEIFRKYTSTTREAMQQRLDAFRAATGKEPTVYELLDLDDRQKLQTVFDRLDRGQQARGAEMARARVESIPREVGDVVRGATRGQRKRNIGNLASALPESRGAPRTDLRPEEARLAVGAADNPTRLAQLRREEARNIMGPYDERKAVDDFSELIPTTLKPGKKPGEVVEVPSDPEMAAVLRAAAGSAKIRPEGEGLTIRELTGMITELKGDLTRGSVIERGVAQRAIDHLESVIASRHPDVAPALARMNEAWAARSRQIEGMLSTKPQTDVNPANPRRLQQSENIYETPEGGVGRAAGQRTELLDDLGAANAPALGTVRQLAESDTAARQIAGNIGVPATRQITDAARAQSESARRLVTAVRDPKFDVTEIESGDLAILAAGLNPGSMTYTKARALTILLQRFGNSIPESRSRTIIDMLFSRDPAMTQRALNALRAQGETGREMLGLVINTLANTLGDGVAEGQAGDESLLLDTETPAPDAEPDYSQMSDEELMAALDEEQAAEPDYSQMSDEDLLAALEEEKSQGPYGRRVIEGLFPEAVVTDDVRDGGSALGRKNPRSYHVNTDGAVDVRPIPGMTFDEFVATLKTEGHNVVEAIDETKNPSKHATGPHWHIVIGE